MKYFDPKNEVMTQMHLAAILHAPCKAEFHLTANSICKDVNRKTSNYIKIQKYEVEILVFSVISMLGNEQDFSNIGWKKSIEVEYHVILQIAYVRNAIFTFEHFQVNFEN